MDKGGIVGENLPISDSSEATDSIEVDAEKPEGLVDEIQPTPDAIQESPRRPRKPPGFYSNMGFLAMLKIFLLLFVFMPKRARNTCNYSGLSIYKR